MQSTSGFSIAASSRAGHLLLVVAEGGVDAGDHPVERGQEVVGVVEGAVDADVDLRAGEEAEAALALVPLPDLADPLPEPLLGDVVAEPVAGRVVGDRHVGVAAGAAGLRHLLQGVAPVGEGRVAVELAADVGDLDQLRERALARRPQLAPALAQLRLDVGVAEALVDLGLGCAERRPRRTRPRSPRARRPRGPWRRRPREARRCGPPSR